MAVINLKIVVSSLDNVLQSFNRIKVHRSTTGLAGVYSEITTALTRMPLEAAKVVYEYADEAGASSYFYRVSYYNTTTGLESSLSEPQQGEGDPALGVMSVEEFKVNYLFGVDLTDEQGTPYPESLYEFYIKAAVSYVERYLDTPLRPTQFEESHDFDPNAYDSYIALFLDHYPVISVESVKLLTQAGEVAQDFPREWIRVQKSGGQVNIVPSGSMGTLLLGASSALLPRFGGARFVPDVFQVSYTAGFASCKVPDDIRNVIGLIASYGPLNIAGDLVGGAGLAAASLSMDGLSQSITTSNSSTNAGYGARLLEYAKQVKMYLPEIRRALKGVKLTVA